MIELNIVGSVDYTKKVYKCYQCKLPIVKYGRMLPCKHFFCITCTKHIGSIKGTICPRCGENVINFEIFSSKDIHVCPLKDVNGNPCLKGYSCADDVKAHINTRHSIK